MAIIPWPEEIQKHFKLINSGDKVLDLGAAPGSFMQFIWSAVGDDGLVVGVDLKPIEPFKQSNIKTYVGDIFDEMVYKKILSKNGIFLECIKSMGLS